MAKNESLAREAENSGYEQAANQQQQSRTGNLWSLHGDVSQYLMGQQIRQGLAGARQIPAVGAGTYGSVSKVTIEPVENGMVVTIDHVGGGTRRLIAASWERARPVIDDLLKLQGEQP